MIVLEPNDGDGSNYFKYPLESKVLSGVLFGRENEYKGQLDPKDYVHGNNSNQGG